MLTLATVEVTADASLELGFDDGHTRRIDGEAAPFATGPPWALHKIDLGAVGSASKRKCSI